MSRLGNIQDRIRGAFSNAAIQYDVLASLQKDIGRELSKKIFSYSQPECILDVAMGTGITTNRLNLFCPGSQVVGLDFADGMIEAARKKYDHVTFIQADARKIPFQSQTFELVFSNLSYQWIMPLSNSFSEAHRVLKSKGHFIFTLFGYKTFQELFESLEVTDIGDKKPEGGFKRLVSSEFVSEQLAQCGFKDVQIKSEFISVRFKDVSDLLRWIRGIGANELNSSMVIGKEWFTRAEEYYNQHYRSHLGITSTFEVIWVEATK